MKIIIYGLGRYTEKIVKAIKNTHEIIGYSDSFSSIKTYGRKPFIKCDKLKTVEFDYIIITVVDRKVATRISDDLYLKYHISKEKIIPFFACSHKSEIECKLYQMKKQSFDGIILGNSHARCGIDENVLQHKFINLALRSQDLYCNKRVCELLEEQKKQLACVLSYAIIDLFDYNVLNIDNSRSTGFYEYIGWGGIMEAHNYNKNDNYKENFKDGLYKHLNIILDSYGTVIEELFDEVEMIYSELYMEEWRDDILKCGLEEKQILSSNRQERREDTIDENKKNLRDLVQILQRINPHIKIVFTILPRYEAMELVENKMIPAFWKKELENEVLKICRENGFLYINYKNSTEIYENKYFWMDACHLNNIGAKAFTYKLSGDLWKVWK